MIEDEIDGPGPIKILPRHQVANLLGSAILGLIAVETVLLLVISWWWRVRIPALVPGVLAYPLVCLAQSGVSAWHRRSGWAAGGMPTGKTKQLGCKRPVGGGR